MVKYRIELITRTGMELSWSHEDTNGAYQRWDKVVNNTLEGETCKFYKMPSRTLLSEYTREPRREFSNE